MIKLLKIVFNLDTDEFSRLIRDCILIFIVTIFIGFIANIFLPKGFTFVNTSIQESKNIILISSDEAKIKKDTGSAVFLDSRQTNEYNELHIEGAINIPATPASIAAKKINEKFDQLAKPVEIIIYCGGDTCGSSKILADRLISMGYSRHLYIIENGIDEWEKKEYPIERSNKESHEKETAQDAEE